MLKVTRPRFRPRFPSRSFAPGLLFGSGIQGVWYDPSDFSTMFQDVAGTTPVTAVGQSVALIRDKSGNGNHATQSVPASMPTLNVDASGRYFLLFDGSDDSMLTNSINFSASDKMTVIVGLRKLSDGTQFIAELSSAWDGVSTGTFALGSIAGSSNYFSALKGTATAYYTQTTFAAPITNVLTSSYDIGGVNINTEIVPRVNGTTPTLVATGTNAGTGNFGSHPLYIGRRNNSILPFNGRLYSMIVRGAASTPSEIVDTESWVNGKTGAY